MSAVVKLGSKLPGDFETNGIDSLVERLLDAPKDLMVSVIWTDVDKITKNVDTGDDVPTIRVRRIEPLGEVSDVHAAIREAVEAAIEKRTGRTPIPWDIAEVVEGHDPDQTSIDDELAGEVN